MVLGMFKIALRLKDRHAFMWQSLQASNALNSLTLKEIFWKAKTFFKKLEYRFLVENSKTASASFPLRTALSEANVKTYSMATTELAFSLLESLFKF